MGVCKNCGTALSVEDTGHCTSCGAPVGAVACKPNETDEFAEVTARLLRWERKAWNIMGNAMIVFGAVFIALFMLLGVLFLGMDEDVELFAAIYFICAWIYGALYVAMCIVNKVLVRKIDTYLAGFQQNPEAVFKRCSSVGMIVFCAFFNGVALVFYIINFVRMKANRAVIDAILREQAVI